MSVLRKVGRLSKVRAVAVTGALASAMLVGVAAPASASFGTCGTTFSNNNDRGYVQAYCSGSRPSSFRAWIKCLKLGTVVEYDGQWEFAGDGIDSFTQCPVNAFWTAYGIDLH